MGEEKDLDGDGEAGVQDKDRDEDELGALVGRGGNDGVSAL